MNKNPPPRIFLVRHCFQILLAIGTLLVSGCGIAQEPTIASVAQDESVAYRTAIAREKFTTGDFSTAIEILQSLCSDQAATDREKAVANFTLGEVYFADGQATESAVAFDRAIKWQPELKPQLWQRGLALYYADRYVDVIDQLESHQNFNSQDVENSVWHMMARAKISSVEEARKNMIEITRDRRVAMSEIYEMFAGRGSVDSVLAAAQNSGNSSTIYHASLYVGLYHEMMGKVEKSKSAIESAVAKNPFGPTVFMGNVARTHAKARGFDKENDPQK